MLKSGVVMVMLLVGADGTFTQGTVPFESYEQCHRSLKYQVDEKYLYAERVCMSAALHDNLTRSTKKFVKDGGPKSDYSGPIYIK